MKLNPSPQPSTAIYARYSSHNQDEGTSIEVQLEACRRAAAGSCREYIDRAVTGTIMSRPEFNRLLQDAEAGLIRTLIVYKWDRFGRSAHAHAVIDDLEQMGVQVISATEGQEALTRGIQLVVAKDFSDRLGARIADTKLRDFHQGKWHGGRSPYGYKVTPDNRLEIEPGEAAVVRRIYDLFLGQTIGIKGIAKALLRDGITKRGAVWDPSSIAVILRQPAYAGVQTYRVYATAKQARRGIVFRSKDQNQRRECPELAIFSRETWEAVQAKRAERSAVRPPKVDQVRRFSRMIACGCCGGTFIRRYRARCSHQPYWVCGRRVRIDSSLCASRVTLSEAKLTGDVLAGVDLVAAHPGTLDKALAKARAIREKGAAEARRVAAEVGRLDAELGRLTDRLADPDLAAPAVKRALAGQIAERTERRDALQARYATLAADAHDGLERLERALRQALDELRSGVTTDNDSQFREMIRKYVGPMVAHADGRLTPQEVPHEHIAEAMSAQGIIRKAIWSLLRAA